LVIESIDATLLQKMFLAGAKNIEAKKEYINELNVFPVPDGDTGTNMTMTITSAANEVAKIADPSIDVLAKAISSGSLRGARGNSGVILSQLFRGFTREITGNEVITVPLMAKAFNRAVETAYKAVMKPKEGTILTVAKGGADKANEIANKTKDVIKFSEVVLNHMIEVLDKTPDMLPVLKDAGVVDSGGQGLVEVLRGAYNALIGKEEIEIPKQTVKVEVSKDINVDVSDADIKFGYCTEFIIMLDKKFTSEDEVEFKTFLENLGDSIVVVADDEIVKVHVHTNDPGLAIQKALTYGQLTNMKIDNMRQEHHERVIKNAEKEAEKSKSTKEVAKKARKKVGFISVSAGDGIKEIFESVGVDHVIEGGQTMNPSTEDMLNAIDKVEADNVFILPNNSNIILAAQQAASIVEDKKIYVVPTKTIPQGISAMINFVEDRQVEENFDIMKESLENVKTGQITYAVRDTNIDGKTIKQGDIMGIGDKVIEVVGQSVNKVTQDLVEKLVTDESELISLYYGADVKEEDADSLVESLEEKFSDIDVEKYYGGQPIYYYILSVE